MAFIVYLNSIYISRADLFILLLPREDFFIDKIDKYYIIKNFIFSAIFMAVVFLKKSDYLKLNKKGGDSNDLSNCKKGY